jgi:hypothetical protein
MANGYRRKRSYGIHIIKALSGISRMFNLFKYNGIGSWAGRRFWESRQFYSSYIALFVAITNWITIQYKLVLEQLPFLNDLFSNLWIFMVTASVVFTVISVLGGHYIHRKRQFRLEQAVSVEENPYLYKAMPGKEKDLIIPLYILQLDALEQLLSSNNGLTDERKKQFDKYREGLIKLKLGHSV